MVKEMNKNQKSIKINMLLNSFLRVSSMIFPLVTFPYVSRILGAEGMGKITFSNSIVTYFLMLVELGIPTYGIRVCSKVKQDKKKLSKVVYELLLIESILALFTSIILGISVCIIPKLYENKATIAIFSLTFFLNAIGVEWLYRALEEYSYITWRSLIFKCISMILMFLMIHDVSDLVIYAFLIVLASNGSYLCNIFNIRKYICSIKIFNKRLHCFKHIRPTLTFFAMTVATTVYTSLDNIMLGFMTTDVDVGYYAVSVKVKTFLVSVITSIGIVLLPRATVAAEMEDEKHFNNLLDMSLHVVVLMAIPMATFFMVYARQTIFILSGTEYESSILPMQILLITVFFIGITNILGYQVLVPLNGERAMLLSVTIGLVIDLIINLVLIKPLHGIGTAIGTLLAEFGVFIVQVIVIKRVYKIEIPIFKYYKAWISGLFSLGIILVYKKIELNFYFSMFSGAIVYFGIYCVLLILFKDEIIYPMAINILSKVMHKQGR